MSNNARMLMEMRFSESCVLVTGGSVRIGRQICLTFAELGARIVVHYCRSGPEAEDLVKQMHPHPDGHLVVGGDLTDCRFRSALIPDLLARGAKPDILINNASTYRRMSLLDLSESTVRDDFEINLFAPLMLMRDFKEYCGSGCIINLLDQRVAVVEKGAGAYGLAKKALRDATLTAALEWGPETRVNAVAPGYSLPPPGVPAAKMEPLVAGIPLRRPSPPREVADACTFLASAHSVTGQIIYVDGGLHLAVPPIKERGTSTAASSLDGGST